MTEKKVKIQLQEDMQPRPIAVFVQKASVYDSRISIAIGNKNVNGKSIMGMMSLSLKDGDEITIIAEGTDEKEAVAGLEEYLCK